jgi:hypothetical protein
MIGLSYPPNSENKALSHSWKTYISPHLDHWSYPAEFKAVDNGFFIDQLRNAWLFGMIERNYNTVCGNFVDGFQQGEWLGLLDYTMTDTVIHYSAKDTLKFKLPVTSPRVLDGVYYHDTLPRYYYSIGKYDRGLKEGAWTYRFDRIAVSGQYRNNKRQGAWVQRPVPVMNQKCEPVYTDNRFMIKANFADDKVDGEVTFIDAATGHTAAVLFFEKGKFIGPLLLTWKKSKGIVFYSGRLENGKIVKTFYTPKGDTLPAQNMKHASWHYSTNTTSTYRQCDVYEYRWNDEGIITYERNMDKDCKGYEIQRLPGYIDKKVYTATGSEFIHLDLNGDTITYSSHEYAGKKSKPSGIWIRTDSKGKTYTKRITDHEQVILKRIEDGKVTIYNGNGYITDPEGARVYIENSKAVKRELKNGKEYLLEVYNQKGKPKLLTYIDSKGNESVKNGKGYMQVSQPKNTILDQFHYYLEGERVHKVDYDLYMNPGYASSVRFTAVRTVTKVQPGLYKINYKLDFPYACGRAAVMDTFPASVKIVYVSMPLSADMSFSTKKGTQGLVKFFIDNEKQCRQSADETVWIESSDIDISKIKGQFFFQLQGTRQIPVTNGGAGVQLKNVLARKVTRFEVTNSFIDHERDEPFILNRSTHKVTIAGYEVERTVSQYGDHGNKYYFEVKVTQLNSGTSKVYYREKLNTDNIDLTLRFIPDNYNNAYDPVTQGKNINLRIFSKSSPANSKNNTEEVSFTVSADDKMDFSAAGVLAVDGKEYAVGTFTSNHFNPLYAESRFLSDKEYKDLIYSLAPGLQPDQSKQTGNIPAPKAIEKKVKINPDNPNLLHVMVTLNYADSLLSGFAKLEEQLLFRGAKVSLIEAPRTASFKFHDDKIAVIWIAGPFNRNNPQESITVKYDILIPEDELYNSKCIYKYTKDDEVKTIKF